MERQKLFQIVEKNPELYHAGSKATRDVSLIAETVGYEPVIIRSRESQGTIIGKAKRQILFCQEFRKAYQKIPKNAIVLLQHPFHHVQLSRERILRKLKKRKRVSFICFVHDIQEIRSDVPDRYYKKEFEFMISIADILIVHNKEMFEWFAQRGAEPTRMVVLGMFDYLVPYNQKPEPKYDISINIAGNLAQQKSRYVYMLPPDYGIDIHLFGPNYQENACHNPYIHYHGVYDPDYIPKEINKGFMLIWDGDSLDECAGNFGDYLQYNIPHKLSLSIASGIPVVIWEKAAVAKFVRDNHLGLVIRNLYELPGKIKSINAYDYKAMTDSVMKVRDRITHGYYTTQALQRAVII